MTRSLIASLFFLLAVAAVADDSTTTAEPFPKLHGPYLGQAPPGKTPILFAPDVIPVDGIQHCVPAFSPDGREVYWSQVDMSGDVPRAEILFMEEREGIWCRPTRASFSGVYSDQNPAFSPDGMRLVFTSRRPGGPGMRSNLWYVERTEDGWSEPELFDAPPNSELGLSQVSFTNDGTAFFVARMDSVQWGGGMYFATRNDGRYMPPQPLDTRFNTRDADVYPFVSPDGSYFLFGSSRPGGNSKETDLYLARKKSDGSWGNPVHLGEAINNGFTVSLSRVTYDGRYLFFNRFDEDGTDKFYWVDASILNDY